MKLEENSWRILGTKVSLEKLRERGPKSFEVGVYWSKDEFVKQARELKHPFDKKIEVPEKIAEVWTSIARLGPKG
eukprot:12100384-Karenia_brevis.AAC.1